MSRRNPHRRATTCEWCGQPIIWAITASGARQPLDPEPNPDGNTLAYKDALGVWRARSLTSVAAEGAPRHPLEKPHMPHFATCSGPKQLQVVMDNVTPLRRQGRR
jgi:hypothetical protein